MPLSLLLPLSFSALAFFLLPFVGAERFFSMRVSPEWLTGPQARRIRHTYQAAVVLVTALCVASNAHFEVTRHLTSVILNLNVMGLLVAWSWGWSRTLPFRYPQPVVRTALLRPQSSARASHRWSLAALLPIVGTALLLLSKYRAIPAPFAIQFYASGVSNHVVLRSCVAVFGPLLIGATEVLLLAEILHTIQERGAGLVEKQYSVLTRRLIVGVTWMVAMKCAASGLLPIMKYAEIYAVHLGFFSELASLVFLLITASLLVRDRSILFSGQSATDEIHWKGGLLYFNREDAALFVPFRLGFGWTLNMAQPSAWLVLALIMAVAFVQLAVSHL